MTLFVSHSPVPMPQYLNPVWKRAFKIGLGYSLVYGSTNSYLLALHFQRCSPQLTQSTSEVYFHKFFARRDFLDHDRHVCSLALHCLSHLLLTSQSDTFDPLSSDHCYSVLVLGD